MLIRRAAAALLVLVAAVACLMAVVTGGSIDHTIQNSALISGRFKSAANAIDSFHKSHGRLPSGTELDAVLPPDNLGTYLILVAPSGFDQCDRDTKTYRDLRGSDYVLIAWRGEWWECYAPTKSMSTLLLQPADYTMFGAVWRDRLAFLSFAALCLLAALKLSVRRKQAKRIRV